MKAAYDYIVLGAGAAGCVAARTLASKYPSASIALIDQGGAGAAPTVMRVPFLQPFIVSSRKARGFVNVVHGVPEDNLGGRRLAYTCGCGLGGSTLCSDMKYLRGTRADVSAWAATEWSFDALLPFFTSLENNSRGASEMHGDQGPFRVSDLDRSSIDSMLNVRFFEACEAAGIAPTDDFNCGETAGFSALQSLTDHGTRVDVFSSCVAREAHRLPRLEVHTHAHATRILFDEGSTGSRGIAAGVEITQGKEVTRVSALCVVVCLGAIESAALLLRSGIGPNGPVADSAQVGKNLIQGCSIDLVFRLLNNVEVRSKSVSVRNAPYMWGQWREYNEDCTGALASFTEAAAFVPSLPEMTSPDLSLLFFCTAQVGLRAWRRAPILDGVTLRVTHHYPESRGEVSLSTSSSAPLTLVRSNMASTKHDVSCMDEGVKWAGLLLAHESELRSVYHCNEKGTNVGPFWFYRTALHHPRRGMASLKDVAASLAQYAESSGDLYGTCAMGTVVDSKCRVTGVNGVLVADASVVPSPTVASSSVLGAAIAARVTSLL